MPLDLKNIARPVEAFVVMLGAGVPKGVPLAVTMPDLSIAKAPRSIRLDPLSPFNRTSYQRIGIGLLLLGREEPSIEWLQRALAAGWHGPTNLARAMLSLHRERLCTIRPNPTPLTARWPRPIVSGRLQPCGACRLP